ncbi:hypothetical protein BCR35DRAFT_309666 [Leucosporidium creatinivorum]|uniref:Uncharacterized protein n=1 Tax=Leucosporidium creatinivorum TaxID=106004 RepID=A0A1Y2DDY2_9BASI|nr:hypothetical protein BCR35DRAFT_309666 [Leucosporidium creatinivorum]
MEHSKPLALPISTTSTLTGQALSDTTGLVAGAYASPLPISAVELPLSLAEYKKRALHDLVAKAKASGASGVIDVEFEVRLVASGVGVLTMEDLQRG